VAIAHAAGFSVALGALAGGVATLIHGAGWPSVLTWLPPAVAAATLLRYGTALGPAFAIGALLGAVLGGLSGSLAAIHVLPAAMAASLLARSLERSDFDRAFRRWQDVLRFVLAAALATAVGAAMATLAPAVLGLKTSGAPLLAGAWLRAWLCAYLATLLAVPIALDVTRQTLTEWADRALELSLVGLATLLLIAIAFGAPNPIHGFLVGPPALVLVGYTAVRFQISIAAAVAGMLTCAIGLSAQGGPVSQFVAGLFGLARPWAFGFVNACLLFTVQVLRAERRAALEALRDAEHRHQHALLQAAHFERLKIGQQLHDEVGQEATALSLLARSLARRLAQRMEVLPSDAESIVESAARIHLANRNAVQRLLAIEQHGGSLPDALRSLIERLRQAGAPAIALQIPETLPSLAPEVAEVLFRTAQEALTNAVKHAEATKINVRVVPLGSHVELRVTDDGIGLTPQPLIEGWGLRTMRGRAAQVGGQLRTESGRGTRAGTEIVLAVPWVSVPPR
jgi:signal transduction histidine kinase